MQTYWSGEKIVKLSAEEVFVFGSNPQGIHGAGAAKSALDFGAKYGIGRGLQGSSYALVTKNLKAGFREKATGIVYEKEGFCSVSINQIKENVEQLYECARAHPELSFLISFTCKKTKAGGYEKSLNGYDGLQMVEVFLQQQIPPNIVFHDSYKPHVESHLKKQAGAVFFYGYEDYLSNFHPARFVYKEKTFASVEHFFIYCKARQFNDEVVVRALDQLGEQEGVLRDFLTGQLSPRSVLEDHALAWVRAQRSVKQLGRQVSGFDEKVWEHKRENIMKVGLREKFLQNPELMQQLVQTQEAVLIECSPTDRLWGAGCSKEEARVLWAAGCALKGSNLLGQCLNAVRVHCRDQLALRGKAPGV